MIGLREARTNNIERPIDKGLTPEQFRVTQQKGTEPAYSGEYCHADIEGVYRCVCCDSALFSSHEKYDSGTGWPSFTAPLSSASVKWIIDNSFLMRRTEVICAECHAHLGHVFNDGPRPTNRRYCVNSVALRLDPALTRAD